VAERAIEDSTAKIDRKRAEVEEHEANLKKEEDVLESIRDSLKGALHVYFVRHILASHVLRLH
jgi:structural maintenance of chromosome 4